ncbi:MAG: type II and III secretion system protein family protein [Planctomycetes bacterium]|nr:type II and III secretion system protein family protein [Planctomycetota bacterium]
MTPQPPIADRRSEPGPSPRYRLFALVAILAACWPYAPAVAQQPASVATAEHPEVEITVRNITEPGRLINVPVNKSVLVDFNVPLREVRVAKADIAEAAVTSPKQIILTGKTFGTTQMVVWLNENDQRIFNVAVDIDLDRLQASIRSTVPRAKVKAHAVLDSVVLAGTVPDAEAAQHIMEIAQIYSSQVVNHMRVAGVQQILLRCTVAEVNRSAMRQLGFNGWIGGDNLHDVFGVNQLGGINPVNIGGAAGWGPIGGANATAIPFGTDQGLGLPLQQASTLSLGFPRVQMQVFIQALRENGLLRVLAEPNLVTINGQEASFLAGGELPIPLATDEKIKIEWKEFGVRLNFTPAVLSPDIIRLQVAPEMSELDYSNAVTFGGFVLPGITSRRVQTVVELGPGQTFAIGGLLSERTRGVTRKVPGLGDLPVLGPLFSSVEYQWDETEFVVLVTPEMVAPITPDQIAYVPGNDLVAPNDFELFLQGKLEGTPAETPHTLRPRINNSWPVRPNELYGSTSALKLRGPLGPAAGEEGL